MSRRKISIALGAAACITLILTAALHSTAWPAVSEAASDPSASPIAEMFLKPMWLFPVATWVVLTGLLAIQLRHLDRRARSTMIVIGAIPLLQALTLFAFVGQFVGAYAPSAAAALIWASAVAIPNDSPSV